MPDAAVAEIILNEPGVGSLVGEGEAASMAQHVGMRGEGQGGCFAISCKARLTVERCNGLRCWLTKKLLPPGLSRERSFSHAPIARSSSVRSGCVVDSPPSIA
jgi:hypothetical protein